MPTLRYLVEIFELKAIGLTSIFSLTITKSEMDFIYSWPEMNVLKFYKALLFKSFLHVCIGKGWLSIQCTEDNSELFYCLLQTFLINIIIIMSGGCHLVACSFWLEVFCCAGSRKVTLQIKKLLLFWVEMCRLFFVFWDDVGDWDENQKQWCGCVYIVFGCMYECLRSTPIDTHRKAIDCRSSTVFVSYCLSPVFNSLYWFTNALTV